MTSRGFALIWCAAITLVTLIVVALNTFTKAAQDNFDNMPAAPVVVIGSSLMKSAVPSFGQGNDSLLGDGRAHVRYAVGSITEDTTVELLRLALNDGAKTVLIEANALAFDFASKGSTFHQDGAQLDRLIKPLFDLSTRIRQKLREFIFGQHPTVTFISEADNLDNHFSVKPNAKAKYPLYLRLPQYPDLLEATLMLASKNGVELILIAPPRSQWAADVMGPEATETLRLHFQTLSDRLNLPLFQPSAVWSNEHFIDAAHMSRQGRTRFLNELAQWWASRP
jgi:hypothetical protein